MINPLELKKLMTRGTPVIIPELINKINELTNEVNTLKVQQDEPEKVVQSKTRSTKGSKS